MNRTAAIARAKEKAAIVVVNAFNESVTRSYVVIDGGMGYFTMSYDAWVNSTMGPFDVIVSYDTDTGKYSVTKE